MLESI
jgi:hypothetical protein